MQRCLELAQRGMGMVAPNPMVGCVIVYQNEIISEGWHEQFGENHAERNAILALNDDSRLQKSTLYVNLEPCAHHGKTPPCSNLIVESGIRTVVIGSEDPFEKVNGKGIEILKKAGIEVIENILQKECDLLNKRFLFFHKNKSPYIILKWAETKDGFMAPNIKIKQQISGEQSRILLHKWRSEESAILVGANTIEIDKPMLDVRYWQGKNPIRLAMDGNLKNKYPYDELPMVVFNYSKDYVDYNITFVKIPEINNLNYIRDYLYSNNIISVMIEGGSHILQQFIDANAWNEIRIIKSKTVLFEEGLQAPVYKAISANCLELNGDIITTYYNL